MSADEIVGELSVDESDFGQNKSSTRDQSTTIDKSKKISQKLCEKVFERSSNCEVKSDQNLPLNGTCELGEEEFNFESQDQRRTSKDSQLHSILFEEGMSYNHLQHNKIF